MAVDLDNQLGGRAVQIRLIQGKEPEHFLAIFGGKLIIYSGGRASAFESQEGEKDDVLGDTYMLQVRGNAAYNTKAIQVHCRESKSCMQSSNERKQKYLQVPLKASQFQRCLHFVFANCCLDLGWQGLHWR